MKARGGALGVFETALGLLQVPRNRPGLRRCRRAAWHCASACSTVWEPVSHMLLIPVRTDETLAVRADCHPRIESPKGS
jgi:hypothetical protein